MSTPDPRRAELLERLEVASFKLDLERLEAFDSDNIEKEKFFSGLLATVRDAIHALRLPASPPTKPECMTQSEFDEAVGSAAHAASPPEPPASPPNKFRLPPEAYQLHETIRMNKITPIGTMMFCPDGGGPRFPVSDEWAKERLIEQYGADGHITKTFPECDDSSASVKGGVLSFLPTRIASPASPPPAPVTPKQNQDNDMTTAEIEALIEKDADVALLLTVDGAGRKKKEQALNRLLCKTSALSSRNPVPSAAASDERVERLREATKTLCEKLRSLPKDDRYMAPWVCYHYHGGKYDGPFYDEELAATEAALAESRK